VKCPKCNFEILGSGAAACPKCGVVFAKVQRALADEAEKKVSIGPDRMGTSIHGLLYMYGVHTI
jgi:hypothetical protein